MFRFSSSRKYVGLVPVQTHSSVGGFQKKNRKQLCDQTVVPYINIRAWCRVGLCRKQPLGVPGLAKVTDLKALKPTELWHETGTGAPFSLQWELTAESSSSGLSQRS